MDQSLKEAVKVFPLSLSPFRTSIVVQSSTRCLEKESTTTEVLTTVVLRNASAYSCILSKPVRLKNIRGKRHTPGLKQQHLSGLQLLAEITHGKLEGGFVKSGQISFFPGESLVTQTDFTSDQYGAGYLPSLTAFRLERLLSV